MEMGLCRQFIKYSNTPCKVSCQGPVQLRESCVPATATAGYMHCCNLVAFKCIKTTGNCAPRLILGCCSRICGSKDVKELESHFGTSEMKNKCTSSVKPR